MKILVTGAAGFIGPHLVEKLVKSGESVRCLIRKKDNPEFLPKEKIKIFVGDITDKKTLIPAVAGVDIIYHLAAKTDFLEKSFKDYYLANVLGTQNLIDLALREKIKRFVFFSTIRTVGLSGLPEPVKETAPYNPQNFYDKSKVEAEKILLSAYQKNKLPVVIIRPSSVYGPDNKGTYFSFFKAIAQGKFILIGSGQNLVSFVYVGNVVDGAILAAKNKKAIGQTYFINDNRPYTMKELADTIAWAFGRKLLPVHLPRILGYFGGYCLQFFGGIFNFNPPLTPQRVRNLTTNYVFDISKAKEELGYRPKVDLKTGVRETVNWYKKHGWI